MKVYNFIDGTMYIYIKGDFYYLKYSDKVQEPTLKGGVVFISKDYPIDLLTKTISIPYIKVPLYENS